MRDVTVGIKAFIRLAELDTALTSLQEHGFYEVIVADDSQMTTQRRALYETHRRQLPLRVLELPFRSGLAFGRNRMVEACSTEYFLLMDDDMALTGRIDPLREVLDSDSSIGGVAALLRERSAVRSGCLNLHAFTSCLVLDAGSRLGRANHRLISGTRYYLYDMIDNFTLFRTATFDDVKWDEFYVTNHEHADFYLTHKRLGKWRFALTPDYFVLHEQSAGTREGTEYQAFRRDPVLLQATLSYFKQKWNLPKGMISGVEHLPQRFSAKGHLNSVKLELNGLYPFYR